jgi:hypothetical protein
MSQWRPLLATNIPHALFSCNMPQLLRPSSAAVSDPTLVQANRRPPTARQLRQQTSTISYTKLPPQSNRWTTHSKLHLVSAPAICEIKGQGGVLQLQTSTAAQSLASAASRPSTAVLPDHRKGASDPTLPTVLIVQNQSPLPPTSCAYQLTQECLVPTQQSPADPGQPHHHLGPHSCSHRMGSHRMGSKG